MKRIVLLALAALALSACSLAGDLTPPPALATAQASGLGFPPTAAPVVLPDRLPDPAAGEPIYLEKCAPCHGEAGDGKGVQASELPNPPTAFIDPEPAQRAMPEAWFNIVTEGRFERFMPGFSSLDDDQRWDVVGYALSLSLPREAIEAGRDLFVETCAECHAADGTGVGGVVDLTTPEFQSGRSWLALYGAITNGAGEGMPSYADTLSEDQRWALAAFVRSLGLKQGDDHPAPTETVAATTEPTSEAVTPLLTALPQTTPTPESGGVAVGCQVLNGTAGFGAPQDLEVTLHGFDDAQEAMTQTAVTDGQGRCTFDPIEPAAGRSYLVTTSYQDVLYASEIIEIPGDATEIELPVLVFEAAPETDSVSISRLHLLFEVPVEGVLRVVELWLLSNSGDRTVYEGENGALEVVLPDGATGLSLDGGEIGERYELTPIGFRDRRELVPGENTGELVFSYNLPHRRRTEFARPVGYPVAAVVAMTAEGGPTISGEGIEDQGARPVSGTELQSYALPPVEAGGEIRMTLQGGTAGASTATPEDSSVVLGVAGLALAAIGVVLLWRRPRKAAPAAEPAPEATGDEAILWAIASLDNELAAGRVTAEEHRARRDDLLRRLGSTAP